MAVAATVDDNNGVTASAYVLRLSEANIGEKDSLTVVLVKKSPDPQPAAVTVPAHFAGAKSFHAVTSSDGKLWQESDVAPTEGKLSLTIPGYGVVTLFGQG